jgi:hypothetical protein
MEIQLATKATTPNPMGNPLSGLDAGQDEVAGAGFLFFDYSESRHAYILHGRSPDPILVRTYISG